MLAKDTSLSGTRWRVHQFNDGNYGLECAGMNDTADGTGARWRILK